MAVDANGTRAVSLETQEIRVALTMTGGVSLAIWMGGVARELSVLMQASRWRRAGQAPTPGSGGAAIDQVAFYGKLLDFLDVLVDVDVASGTSAGGINAVLLAFCRANDLDISQLRDTWLQLGAMEDLLRDPAEADIPSLMYGDDKLMAGLATALDELRKQRIEYPPAPPLTVSGIAMDPVDTDPKTTLFVTATLLDGEPTAFTDDFGTLVRTTDHHCVFTFGDSDLTDKKIDGALALAGRSTASFPGAFEPSFLPARQATPKIGDVAARVPVGEYTGITRAHWAADGGLMNNQPIDLVLERVFDTRAVRPVRRVLLYVIPSTGDAPSDASATPGGDGDVPSAPLTLVQALLKDATSAMSQSIAEDLRAIRTHNARVSARVESRAQLARLGSQLRPEVRLLDVPTLTAYIDMSVGVVAESLTDAVLSAVCAYPEAPSEAWSQALALGSAGEHDLNKKIRAGITASWHTAPPAAGSEDVEGTGTGLPQTYADFASYGQPALDAGKAIALRLARMTYAAGAPNPDSVLGQVATIHLSTKAKTRVEVRDFRDALRETVFQALAQKATPADVGTKVADLYTTTQTVSDEQWQLLAQAVTKVLAATPPRVAGELQALRDYLGGPDPSDAAAVGRRLFDLATAERAMRSTDVGPEQAVELIQASADTRSLLSDRESAVDKLTGMQFHHFGAFYKRSWRANDWMWGRLDGAGWLVHVLLDPRRLAAAARRDSLDVGGLLAALTKLAGAAPAAGDGPGALTAVTAELRAVLGPEAARPTSLPDTALWVSTAIQRLIANEELPTLADQVLGADWSPANSRTWAREVRAIPAADAWTKLRDCRVPDETFATDRGAPLMARTLTKAAATTGGALASATAHLPSAVKTPVASVRTVTLAAYRLVRVGSGAVKTTILLGLTALVVGVILAAQSTSVLGLTGLSIAGAGAIMLALGAWQWRRGLLPAVLGLLVTLGLFVVIALTDVRHYLFGKSAKDGGVVGRHIYWLGSSWTHPAEVLLILVVLVVLLSLSWPKAKSAAVRSSRSARTKAHRTSRPSA